MELNLWLQCQVDILLMLLWKHLNTEVNENVKVIPGRMDNEHSHIVIVSRLWIMHNGPFYEENVVSMMSYLQKIYIFLTSKNFRDNC